MPTERVTRKVCNVCGASYTAQAAQVGSAAHTRATGHNDWKRQTIEREAAPSRISYQPGYGPKDE